MTDAKIPYPDGPDPDLVPDDYTLPPKSYRTHQSVLLVSLFIFLFVYIVAFVGCLAVMVWFLTHLSPFPVVKILGALFFLSLAVVMVSSFFPPQEEDETIRVPLTEDEQPILFGFINRVCNDVGVEGPDYVYAIPDVNAQVRYRTSILNLFVPPKKELRFGLALVNQLNLSEFQAVLGHEFGHFAQGSFTGTYTQQVVRVVYGMISEENWLARLSIRMKELGSVVGLLGGILGLCLAIVRKPLVLYLRILGVHHFQLGREAEFHADRVAAAVAGSNAIVHGLYRLDFASEAFHEAFDGLNRAAEHDLFTADIYYHHHAAADYLRRKRRKPKLGIPPNFSNPIEGKKTQIFEEEQDIDPAEHGDEHPSHHEREENVKTKFIPAPIDERSPWLLFQNAVELRERMTVKVAKKTLEMPRSAELSSPRKVQEFIDAEKSEITFDPKYDGLYDHRPIKPGNLDELNDKIRQEPWDDARIVAVHEKLYANVKGRAEDRRDLMEEREEVVQSAKTSTNRKIKRRLKELDKQLEEFDDWFAALDRRVYLVYVQMSYRVSDAHYVELINRYRFHMTIQGIYRAASHQYDETFIHFYILSSVDQNPPEGLFEEVQAVLREARNTLKKLVREARSINMPAMKHFEEGERLADYLLDSDVVREMPRSMIKGKLVMKLMNQLERVRNRSARLHGKSMGGILKLQEEIAGQFFARGAKPEILEAEILDVPLPPTQET